MERSATCVGKYVRSPLAFALANAALTRLGRFAGARIGNMSSIVCSCDPFVLVAWWFAIYIELFPVMNT
jgi:hypothetical protein